MLDSLAQNCPAHKHVTSVTMQLALFSFIIGKRPEKKSEKPIPTKETPGIVEKPKLKATGKAKVEESPMEKLKRLENGKRLAETAI